MEITFIYSLLTLIQDAESRKDYDERNKLVYSLLYRASTVGWNCGIRIDPVEPDWPVIYIDLPTGQVSWHVKAYDGEWDGHDNEEKAKRIAQFAIPASQPEARKRTSEYKEYLTYEDSVECLKACTRPKPASGRSSDSECRKILGEPVIKKEANTGCYCDNPHESPNDQDTALTESIEKYSSLAKSIGTLVGEKNYAYGDAFGESKRILEILYPEGIEVANYEDLLTIVRVLDKLFRVTNKKDAFGESPWKDICGYALLAVERDEREQK